MSPFSSNIFKRDVDEKEIELVPIPQSLVGFATMDQVHTASLSHRTPCRASRVSRRGATARPAATARRPKAPVGRSFSRPWTTWTWQVSVSFLRAQTPLISFGHTVFGPYFACHRIAQYVGIDHLASESQRKSKHILVYTMYVGCMLA